MGTTIRADLSKKNKWWIPKHRYYELKHFCMQYPEWKRMKLQLNEYGKSSVKHLIGENGSYGRPVETIAERMTYFELRMEMVEKAAKLTDDYLGDFVMRGVIRGLSYDALYASQPIPCCRDVYYDLYHKFFYILNQLRG